MSLKKISSITMASSTVIIIFIIVYFKYIKQNDILEPEIKESKDLVYNSNIIENVNYTSVDSDGNKYTITASQGEIDYSNPNILYLTNVKGIIQLNNSDNITIFSNYGKYNSQNFDTIFSKNVIINYLENKITGEYLDFSLERNSLVISKKVIYTNFSNILKADALEMNLKTKDTSIFMYEKEKKVNIMSKN
tara:strand:- start:715 stop:1290 length:576 start_codon:yes stop_codon:yes gene_type:complete